MDTNQQIVKLFEVKINAQYQQVRQLLLNPISYQQEQGQAVNMDSLNHYFRFIESAIQRPYNRLSAVFVFTTDEEGTLYTSKMTPLWQLIPKAKEEIEHLFYKIPELVKAPFQNPIKVDNKKLSFLYLFKSNQDRIDQLFVLLKRSEVRAIDSNNNWIYINVKVVLLPAFRH